MIRARENHRILTCDCRETEVIVDPAINLSDDTVFEFLSEEFEEMTSPGSRSSFDEIEEEEEAEDAEKENRNAVNDRFWENQHQLLQSTIRRTSSLESRIRSITKEAVVKSSSQTCNCITTNSTCRKCMMESVSRRLQNAGYDSAICKSKWRSSPDIPSGEHTFIDVIDTSSSKRIIIEVNFRAEFEMARGHNEYDKLVERLPEVFVGKVERLVEVVKIVCTAAKKCMKEKKMHMPPWRKHRYMQAKWLKTCQRMPLPPATAAGRPMRAIGFMEGFSVRGAAVAVG